MSGLRYPVRILGKPRTSHGHNNRNTTTTGTRERTLIRIRRRLLPSESPKVIDDVKCGHSSQTKVIADSLSEEATKGARNVAIHDEVGISGKKKDASLISKQVVINLFRCDDISTSNRKRKLATTEEESAGRRQRRENIGPDTSRDPIQEQPVEKKYCSIAPIEKEMEDEDKLVVLANAMDMDASQAQRFLCYLHSGLNFSTVRSLMQMISRNPVDAVCVWIVCDLVKEFVEYLVGAALDFEESCGWNGPITRTALITASLQWQMNENSNGTA